MKKLLFALLLFSGSLFAQPPASGTAKNGKYQMNFPDLGTKNDSIVLWDGVTKILKYIPRTSFSLQSIYNNTGGQITDGSSILNFNPSSVTIGNPGSGQSCYISNSGFLQRNTHYNGVLTLVNNVYTASYNIEQPDLPSGTYTPVFSLSFGATTLNADTTGNINLSSGLTGYVPYDDPINQYIYLTDGSNNGYYRPGYFAIANSIGDNVSAQPGYLEVQSAVMGGNTLKHLPNGLDFYPGSGSNYTRLRFQNPTGNTGTVTIKDAANSSKILAFTSDIPAPAVIDAVPTNGSANAVSSDGTFDALQLKANDANVVHNTGPETVAGSKTFSSPIIGSITGNSGTATALQTARNINGVPFDGTGPITVVAAAGTLTGSALASGVTASSLLSAAGGTFGTAAFTNSGAYFPAAGGDITGTAGSGYVGLIPQSSTPATPSTGVRLFADSAGGFSWIGVNGFYRKLSFAGLTQNTTVTFPNVAAGTVAYNDNVATFTNKNISFSSNTFSGLLADSFISSASVWNSKEPGITAGTTAQYWRGDKSWQTLNKSAVGLGNVDNTADVAKPISTATQAALDLKTGELITDITDRATTAVTTEQIISNLPITANMFKASSFLNFSARFSGSGTAGAKVIKFYLSPNNNSLTGATQIVVLNFSAAQLYIAKLQREFTVNASGVFRGHSGLLSATNDNLQGNTPFLNLALTLSNPYYLITTITLANSADVITQEYVHLTTSKQ